MYDELGIISVIELKVVYFLPLFELCEEVVIDFGLVLSTVIDYKEDMLTVHFLSSHSHVLVPCDSSMNELLLVTPLF